MATITVTKRVPSRNFSDNAVFWMKELQQHPEGDLSVFPPAPPNKKSQPVLPVVGSQWPDLPKMEAKDRQRYHVTDCIGFVTDVLQFAYLDVGETQNAAKVKRSPWAASGMDLAKYLVEQLRWKAYYWNPDPGLSVDRKYFEEKPEWFIGWYCYGKFHDGPPSPANEDKAYQDSYQTHFKSAKPEVQAKLYEEIKRYVDEHSFTAHRAKKPGVYGAEALGKTVRVTDSITGYRPNPRGTPVPDYRGQPQPKEPALPPPEATQKAWERYTAFASQVKFGFGVVRGGDHTYLFSSGNVYELHWDAAPGTRDAYGVTQLFQWGWESGAIVVPPDAHVSLPPAAARR